MPSPAGREQLHLAHHVLAYILTCLVGSLPWRRQAPWQQVLSTAEPQIPSENSRAELKSVVAIWNVSKLPVSIMSG